MKSPLLGLWLQKMAPHAINVVGFVPVEDGKSLQYEDFRQRYLLQNKPVVLTGLMDEWTACKDWVDEHGNPNLQFLANNFGSSNVQVADCGEREFTDQRRLDMTLCEFVDFWIGLRDRKGTQGNRLLYLKDWHFVKEYPDYVAYTTPKFFSDDWLNQYLETGPLHLTDDTNAEQTGPCSDYRFVYMGPIGTWTPLHADVLRSYSWSANVSGTKLWHLLPPEQTPLLYDRHRRQTLYDIYGTVCEVEFPGFSKACWIECVQKAGEIIFVPSGWHHQVTNMEDVISINHNWFNACNLHWVWRLLVDDYKDTVASIEDIRSISSDFEMLCQRNLAANSGMNFHDFLVFIMKMLETVLTENHYEQLEAAGGNSAQQFVFDLTCIQKALENMCQGGAFPVDPGTGNNLEMPIFNRSPWCALKEIHRILGDSSSNIYELPLPPQYCHI